MILAINRFQKVAVKSQGSQAGGLTIATIADLEIFLSMLLQSQRSQRWQRMQRSLSIRLPYNRNDPSDRCAAILAIVAIIWKPSLSNQEDGDKHITNLHI